MDHTGATLLAGGAGIFILVTVLIIALIVAATVFWIMELVDVTKRIFPDPNQKVIWIIIILALHLLGSLIYHFAGRQQGYLPGERPPGV